MADTFSTFQIQELLKINRNTLQSLIDGGFFQPSIRADGKGTRNKFTVDDLYRLHLLRVLMQAGISRRQAAEYADISFENVGPKPKDLKYVRIQGGLTPHDYGSFSTGGLTMHKNYPTDSGTEEITLNIIINLQAIKNQVDNRIKV